MKISKVFISAGLVAIATSFGFIDNKTTPASKINTNPHFAVIELFTSEGCSSCPPADDAIAKLQKESSGKPVYILAFHVDYWNRLGWKDIFSNADYSARQNQYAKYLKIQSVYTPQVVVNGKKEFVGSEESTLKNSISAALTKDEAANLSLSDVKIEQNKISLHYQTEGNGNNSVLLLALVQKNAVSHIKAGENSGRTISHVQIVRRLQSVALSNNKNGDETITLLNGFNPQGWEVIGLIQDTKTGEIIGAAKGEFSSAMKTKNAE